MAGRGSELRWSAGGVALHVRTQGYYDK
jgi:hypothetical protein